MGVTITMEKMLNKVLEMMGVGREVVTYWDGEVATIRLHLGMIDAGTYTDGLWGTVQLDDTDAYLQFDAGDLYGEDEFYLGEGTVALNYADGNKGLAYTSDLETVITDRIADLYDLHASGSEQGMQGDDYLSLDMDHGVA